MIKNILSILGILTIFLGTLVGYNLHQMRIMELVLCSAGEGGFRIPPAVCESYMKQFRSDKEDLEELARSGIDPILNMDSPQKYDIAAFFIGKGLDVNEAGGELDHPDNISPLHASALYNDAERAAFLLAHGTDGGQQSKRFDGLTALELAQKLQKEHPGQNRSELIRILKTGAANNRMTSQRKPGQFGHSAATPHAP